MKRIFLLMVALMLAAARPGAAQEPTPTVNPALTAQMDQLEAATRLIRGLDGHSVERRFPTRDETIRYMTAALADELPADKADHYLRFYTAFDLLPDDIDLRAVYLKLLGSQIAGFYDTDTEIMNVLPVSKPITDALGLTEQITYVHEYTHALQDQHFDLDALRSDEVADNPDHSLAATSLIEGDATNVMAIWLQQVIQKNPLAALQVLRDAVATGGLSIPEGTPPILFDELTFPYEQGWKFVAALQRQGGMAAVDQAFADPPTSATEILHPQKYLDGWQPTTVTLADSVGTLGTGWQIEWDSTLGEWYLTQYLRTQVAGNPAARAADGWNGDHFQIFTDGSGGQAWVLRVAWESTAQQQEFVKTFGDFGSRRFSNNRVRAVIQDGCWTNETEALCFREAGQDVVIAQAPQRAQAEALLDAQAS